MGRRNSRERLCAGDDVRSLILESVGDVFQEDEAALPGKNPLYFCRAAGMFAAL